MRSKAKKAIQVGFSVPMAAAAAGGVALLAFGADKLFFSKPGATGATGAGGPKASPATVTSKGPGPVGPAKTTTGMPNPNAPALGTPATTPTTDFFAPPPPTQGQSGYVQQDPAAAKAAQDTQAQIASNYRAALDENALTAAVRAQDPTAAYNATQSAINDNMAAYKSEQALNADVAPQGIATMGVEPIDVGALWVGAGLTKDQAAKKRAADAAKLAAAHKAAVAKAAAAHQHAVAKQKNHVAANKAAEAKHRAADAARDKAQKAAVRLAVLKQQLAAAKAASKSAAEIAKLQAQAQDAQGAAQQDAQAAQDAQEQAQASDQQAQDASPTLTFDPSSGRYTDGAGNYFADAAGQIPVAAPLSATSPQAVAPMATALTIDPDSGLYTDGLGTYFYDQAGLQPAPDPNANALGCAIAGAGANVAGVVDDVENAISSLWARVMGHKVAPPTQTEPGLENLPTPGAQLTPITVPPAQTKTTLGTSPAPGLQAAQQAAAQAVASLTPEQRAQVSQASAALSSIVPASTVQSLMNSVPGMAAPPSVSGVWTSLVKEFDDLTGQAPADAPAYSAPAPEEAGNDLAPAPLPLDADGNLVDEDGNLVGQEGDTLVLAGAETPPSVSGWMGSDPGGIWASLSKDVDDAFGMQPSDVTDQPDGITREIVDSLTPAQLAKVSAASVVAARALGPAAQIVTPQGMFSNGQGDVSADPLPGLALPTAPGAVDDSGNIVTAGFTDELKSIAATIKADAESVWAHVTRSAVTGAPASGPPSQQGATPAGGFTPPTADVLAKGLSDLLAQAGTPSGPPTIGSGLALIAAAPAMSGHANALVNFQAAVQSLPAAQQAQITTAMAALSVTDQALLSGAPPLATGGVKDELKKLEDDVRSLWARATGKAAPNPAAAWAAAVAPAPAAA